MSAIVVMARCSTVPNDKLHASRPSAAATRERSDEGRLALNPDGHPYSRSCATRERSSLSGFALRMAIQPVAAFGLPTLTIVSSNESQSVGSNCGAVPPVAGIGRKIRFPPAATECVVRGLPRGNSRGAVLLRDRNRMVQAESA